MIGAPGAGGPPGVQPFPGSASSFAARLAAVIVAQYVPSSSRRRHSSLLQTGHFVQSVAGSTVALLGERAVVRISAFMSASPGAAGRRRPSGDLTALQQILGARFRAGRGSTRRTIAPCPCSTGRRAATPG